MPKHFLSSSFCCVAGILCAALPLQAHDTAIYGPVIPCEAVPDSPGCTAMGRDATHLFTVGDGVLSVYDIVADPAKPRLVGQIKSLLGGRQLAVADDILYIFKDRFLVPGRKNDIYLLDPKDCGAEGIARPLRVAGPRLIGVPSWDGGETVVFSCRRNGTVRAYRETEPGRFEYLPNRSYDLSLGTPGRVVFWRNRMLIPGGHLGLLLEMSGR